MKKNNLILISLLINLIINVKSYAQLPIPNSSYNFPDFTLPEQDYFDCYSDELYINVPGDIYIHDQTIINPKIARFHAGKSITILPGVIVTNALICSNPNNEGTEFKIFHSSCDVVITNIIDGHVKKNEKIEFGIKMPQNITDAINNYLNDINPGQSRINPYNPETTDIDYIDVSADFIDPSGHTHHVNGYFYKQFIENGNGWTEQANDYQFRVRFSPDKAGQWNVSFNIKSNIYTATGLTLDPNCSILVNNAFYCDDNPDNLGPLIVGLHHTYLRYRDVQKSFFAIGENIDPPLNTNPNVTQYQALQNGLQELHDGGGNTARIFMSGWTFGPQSDNLNLPDYGSQQHTGILGNYDDRQPHMYELDKTLDLSHDLNIYCILSLLACDEFKPRTLTPTWTTYWEDNPYNSNNQLIIPNINTAEDFFTSLECRKFIKKQMRYFIARYGYQSHILAYEIFNEVDEIPPKTNPLFQSEVDIFQKDIAGYISSLDEKRHLITTSYSGKPDTSTILDDNINLWVLHDYTGDLFTTDNKKRAPLVNDYVNGILKLLPVFPITIHKPVIIDECGSSSPNEMENLTNSLFHNEIWASAFFGGFGSSLYFWWEYVHSIGGEYDLMGLKTFMNDIDFENYYFFPIDYDNSDHLSNHTSENCTPHLEFFALRNFSATRVMGWVHNRTIYWGNLGLGCGYYTCTDVTNCNNHSCDANCPTKTFHTDATDEVIDDCNSGNIHDLNDWDESITIPDLKYWTKYWIDWFIPNNGGVGTDLTYYGTETARTYVTEKLTFGVHWTNQYNPDWAFKIREAGTGNFRLAYDSNDVINIDTINCVNETFCIKDTLMKDDNGGPAPNYNYSWNFGNGSYSSSPVPCFSYSDTGKYYVYVIVTDSLGGLIDSLGNYVYVPECHSQSRKANNSQKNQDLTNHSEGIMIYPNPSHSRLIVKTINNDELLKLVRINDEFGRLLLDLENVNSNSVELNISNFENGVYIISSLLNTNNYFYKKLVKD